MLYPVYAVLFAQTGLSAAEISSLFAIWSVTGFVLEVPSGLWADVYSRRRLLTLAPLLSAAGFALWTFLPCYPTSSTPTAPSPTSHPASPSKATIWAGGCTSRPATGHSCPRNSGGDCPRWA
jgi:MFS family permease